MTAPRAEPACGTDSGGGRGIAAVQAASVCALLVLALVAATCTTREAEPIDVSVRDIVIDPYAVDGKLVRLIGLLHRAPGGDALYWLQHDLERSIHAHGVSVRLSSSWPEGAVRPGTYVAVEGIFEADDERPGSEFNGALLGARNPEIR